jgi:hypothetical protein
MQGGEEEGGSYAGGEYTCLSIYLYAAAIVFLQNGMGSL